MMHVMINNDILIRLRYALNITDLKLVEIFALAGKPMTVEEIRPYFLREDEKAYLECDGPTMGAFFEGLVTSRRGRIEIPRERNLGLMTNPSNNDALKAIRIALELRGRRYHGNSQTGQHRGLQGRNQRAVQKKRPAEFPPLRRPVPPQFPRGAHEKIQGLKRTRG